MSSLITANIVDEWSPLRRALVLTPTNLVDISDHTAVVTPSELAKHPESAPTRRDLFLQQHRALVELLERRGVALIEPPIEPDAFCQTFTRDPGGVIGDTFYIGQLRDTYRSPERDAFLQIAPQFRKSFDLSGDGRHIEWGDVFALDQGNLVLIGQGDTTNEQGAHHLKTVLHAHGVPDVRIIQHTALHLDCCFAPCPNGTAQVRADRLPVSSIEQLEKVSKKIEYLDSREAAYGLSSNLLWINPEEVISNTLAPKTNKTLENMGFKVDSLEMSEPISMWGAGRCLICPIERE